MTSISLPTALKASAAALAIAGAAGFAIAQGNPPTTSSPNPACGWCRLNETCDGARQYRAAKEAAGVDA